jgi:UDPglucose--hexose-1-phosphate uridylyltransferase
VEAVVPEAAYNLILRTAPWRGDSAQFHWRIELLPRSCALAGFELATGLAINPVAPERAAGKLRSI